MSGRYLLVLWSKPETRFRPRPSARCACCPVSQHDAVLQQYRHRARQIACGHVDMPHTTLHRVLKLPEVPDALRQSLFYRHHLRSSCFLFVFSDVCFSLGSSFFFSSWKVCCPFDGCVVASGVSLMWNPRSQDHVASDDCLL